MDEKVSDFFSDVKHKGSQDTNLEALHCSKDCSPCHSDLRHKPQALIDSQKANYTNQKGRSCC